MVRQLPGKELRWCLEAVNQSNHVLDRMNNRFAQSLGVARVYPQSRICAIHCSLDSGMDQVFRQRAGLALEPIEDIGKEFKHSVFAGYRV